MPTTFAVAPRSRRSAERTRARTPGSTRDSGRARPVDLGAEGREVEPAWTQHRVGDLAPGRERDDAPGRRRAAKRRQPVATPRILHHDHGGGAVLAGVQDLVPKLGVVEVLRRAERSPGIRFARLPGHHDDDLAADVESRVVVVAERRRGDPVPGEGDVARDVPVRREREREKVRAPGEGPRRGAGRRHLDRGAGGQAHAGQDLEALEVAAGVAGGAEAEAPELGNEVGRRAVRSRRARTRGRPWPGRSGHGPTPGAAPRREPARRRAPTPAPPRRSPRARRRGGGERGGRPLYRGRSMVRNASAYVYPCDLPRSAARSRTRPSAPAKSRSWLAWHLSASSFRSMVAVMSRTRSGSS